jgi:protein-S-isoprenylcysteine O-methyltransferase Ste14
MGRVERGMRSLRVRMAVNAAKFLGVVAILLFVSAGTVRFWEAWLYLLFNLAWLRVAGSYFLKKDPALVERRLIQDEQGEKEAVQKRVIAIMRVLGMVMLVLAGLDHRFGWSAVPVWVVAAGCVLFVAGTGVVFAVFLENTYTSSIIEVDAAQTVVATGPYRVLRHPMYAGTVLMGLATPLMLGSYWAFLLVPPGWVLLVVRILAEEHFLSDQLRGYAEYMRSTPKRLIPGVW